MHMAFPMERFAPEKEVRFQRRYAERSIPFIRVSLPIAVTLYLFFIAWDFYIDQTTLLYTMAVRLPFSFFAVAVFGFTFLKSFERWSQIILSITVVLGAAGVMLVLAILPNGFTFGTPGLLLVIMYACGIIRLLFLPALMTCVTIVALANVVLALKQASPFEVFNTNVFLVSASIIGLSYTALLEWMERRAFRLEDGMRKEKKASDDMLRDFLPDRIKERLREGERSIAEPVGEATVLFADIVGFTALSHRLAPGHLVELLSDIFTRFDEIAERHSVEKVKTIGDSYMVVAGVRTPWPRSAMAVAEFAIEALAFVKDYSDTNDLPLQVRIGMATGAVVSGVIGTRVPIFDLWGETVNLASRLEAEGIPGAIQVSESTFWRLRAHYEFQERGTLKFKHGLSVNAYLLTGRKVAAGAGLRVVGEVTAPVENARKAS
jgi:class 3 adenylate cyclase